MPAAKLTAKGQITIPKSVREHLECSVGDRIDFQIEGDGSVRLERQTKDFRELRGLLHREGQRAVTVEDMDEAIRRRMVAKFGTKSER